MTIYRFPAEFYFSTTVENHQQIKQRLLPKLQEDLDKTLDAQIKGNARTTHHLNNRHYFDYEMIQNIVWNPFNQMVKEHGDLQRNFLISKTEVQHIWWNYYEPGQYVIPHRHRNCDFAGVYLLSMEGPNLTCLLPNLEASSTLPMYDGVKSTQELSEGDVLIHPSSMLHWTLPTKSDRYVVVFNIKLGFKNIAYDNGFAPG